MKRHLLRVRRLSICAMVAGLSVAGLFITTVSANASTNGDVSIGGQGGTFLNSIISGMPRGGFASRTSWENVFRSGRPNLFGSEFIPTAYYFQPVALIQAPVMHVVAVPLSTPTSFGQVKVGAGTLTLNTAGSYSGSVSSGLITVAQPQVVSFSGSVLNVSQVGSPAEAVQRVPAPVLVGSAEEVVNAGPVVPAPPARRPKPPMPPGVPVVSR